MRTANRSKMSGRAAAMTLAAMFIIALASAHAAGARGPAAEVRAAIDEAAPVFQNVRLSPQQRNQRLREIAGKYFDFGYMARSAMGVHWRALTPAQRRRFVPVFRDYVMNTYLNRLQTTTVEAARKGLQDKVAYNGSDDAKVHGVVKMPELTQPLNVDYALHKTSVGWRLYDIAIDNVSTMASYRDQFNKTINEKGYPALMNELQAKRPAAQ
jgi:phospholipid transport system substrate-binding protein